MPEPLKNSYGPEIPRRIAGMIAGVYPAFPSKAFLRDALAGYNDLELMDRGRHIARAMHRHLPGDFRKSVRILTASLGPELSETTGNGMSSFLYLPHGYYIAEHGLEHFAESMDALHAVTRRFTAEFAIRPILERHPERGLKTLAEWTKDPNEHVRRLVSEGTRPRLPWAARLRAYEKNPAPVIALLEKLRDDPSDYVRRSVANHLNDLGKSSPALLVGIARGWMRGAPPSRRRLLSHALRTLVKQGHPDALAVLGFRAMPGTTVEDARIHPARARIGGKVGIEFVVAHSGPGKGSVMVDFRVHFVKANGTSSPKVFKLKAVTVEPGGSARLAKSVSLARMTTRTLYPGRHAVDVLINGVVQPIGSFELLPG